MSIIPEFYTKAVVSLGKTKNENEGADFLWVGTGFLVYKVVNDDGSALPFLVTNKHVLMGHDSLIMRMIKKDTGELVAVNLVITNEGHNLFITHKDADIDIAVIPLNASAISENNLDFCGFDVDKHIYKSDDLRAQGIDEGSLVHMLGFPMGLVNVNSTLPICRLGCVARISEAQIEESKNIIVDIQNFPGNSGSPIVTRPEIVSIGGTPSFNHCVLLGIVHSYIPYTESLMNTQTKQIVEVRSENSGLAMVHPGEFILDIINSIILGDKQ